MDGSLHTIDLLTGINGGTSFHASQFVYMNIHVHIEDTIVELLDADSLSSLVGRHVNAPIKGRYLGITTLYVSAMQQFEHVIQSQAIRVEVYKAPRIHPHEIFLLPGASYVLTMEGGPFLGVHVKFAV